MSLEATHLRFSLATKNDLGVLDLEKFVAGVIYPDTRRLTGINRNLTHNIEYFKGRKNLTDFEKGWLSHIIGDKIFKEVMEDKFADWILFEDYEDRWSVITAIKIIQDLEDFLKFDIQSVIDFLDYYELHFFEDERKVVEYNKMIHDIYKGKSKMAIEDYLAMQDKLGIAVNKLTRLRKKIIELYEDEKTIEKINQNFEDGIELYEEKYKELIKIYKKSF